MGLDSLVSYLLVAPVTQPGVDSWQLYLPAGDWIDAWTKQVYEGASIVDRPVPLAEIPVYVRRGGREDLLPLFAKVQRVGEPVKSDSVRPNAQTG